MTIYQIKKGQKVQIMFYAGSKKQVIDTYIVESDSDRLILAFPESKKEFIPYLVEGTEIKAFIYTYTGIIIIDSIVFDSPFDSQIVIEYNENQQVIQRRKYTRIPFNMDFFIQKEDGNIKTKTVDISGGGIRFISQTPLCANDSYKVQLRLTFYKKMIKAEGIILKKRIYQENEYVLEFTIIDEKDRNQIIQKCKEAEKKQRKTSF